MLSHDDSLLRKFNPFCFGADLITQSDSIKYFILNGTIALISIATLTQNNNITKKSLSMVKDLV